MGFFTISGRVAVLVTLLGTGCGGKESEEAPAGATRAETKATEIAPAPVVKPVVPPVATAKKAVKIDGTERFISVIATGRASEDPSNRNKGREVVGIDLSTGSTLWKFQSECSVTSDVSVFETYSEHSEFGGAFQAAVASKDAAQVSQFIEFPFRTRGTMEGDPETEHDRSSFDGIGDSLLKADPGMMVDPTTMHSMVASTAEIPKAALEMQDGIAFRVGNFEFAKGETSSCLT